jgi:dTDP-glucose pyrophosphorylase
MSIQKPTLLVLAAGMGSRYGGLKQMDHFGPNGESIIDYSVYDAINAGFGKVVFIIREFFYDEFKNLFDKKFGDKIELAYVTQEINNVPDGLVYNPDREKPWGTAHAIWVASHAINEPFGVINADDYYGQDSYRVLFDFLTNDQTKNYAVVCYYLNNTLSENGDVNRGVCYANDGKHLSEVVECIKIGKNEDGSISYPNEDGDPIFLAPDTLVSMNMWGFKPSYFKYAERQFTNFIIERGHELKSELYIPVVIDYLIKSSELKVKVLNTNSSWFGVTYPEDKPSVMQSIKDLIDKGVYPKNLWQ